MLFLGGLCSISSSKEPPRPASLFPRTEDGALLASGPSVETRGPAASFEMLLDLH